jgi:hypothetical protein
VRYFHRARCLLLVMMAAAGCGTQIREARAVQPNPLRGFTMAGPLPASVALFIFIRDSMDYVDPRKTPDDLRQEYVLDGTVHIPRFWQLRSAARFVVVSKDRLRFHVSVTMRDEREATIGGWRAWLEDESGRRYEPETVEGPQLDLLVLPWSLYPVGIPWQRKREVPGWDAYQGRADFLFSSPNLMGDNRRMLTFVLQRENVQMRFVWRFNDANVVHIEHYGRSKNDDEVGTLVAPYPDAQVARTWAQGENR